MELEKRELKHSLWENRKGAIVSLFWIAILAGSTLLLNLRWSPDYQALEGDSGVYAYIGSSILNGQLPYRDVWEQKPPIGFYLDALALVMFGHSPWAFWWLNVLWVSLTTSIFFLIIKKMMGLMTGCLASFFFLAGVMIPELFQGGNLMEVYGLLPQILVVAAVYQFFAKKQERWVFIAGVMTGVAFLTKQTTIALGLSSILAVFVISLLRREFKQLLLRPLSFAGGMIAVILPVSSYWFIHGAAYDYLDAVLLHSLAYVGGRASFLWSVKNTALSIFPGLYISRLYYIAAGAFILYCFENFRWFLARLRRDRNTPPVDINPVDLTMPGVFIALPVEVALASLGARNFGHYFLTLVPAGAIVAAYITWKTIDGIRSVVNTKKLPALLSTGWLLLSAVSLYWLCNAILIGAPNASQLASINKIFSNQFEMSDLEKYIVNTTNPSDRVLVWHIHTGINFITQRQAATRVLFPMNLFIGDKKMPEFTAQMINNPPELIVFQKPSSLGLPFVDENLDSLCDKGCMPEISEGLKQTEVYNSLKEFQEFFQQHYSLDKQIYDWYVYRYKR